MPTWERLLAAMAMATPIMTTKPTAGLQQADRARTGVPTPIGDDDRRLELITRGIARTHNRVAPDDIARHQDDAFVRLPLVMVTSQLGRCLGATARASLGPRPFTWGAPGVVANACTEAPLTSVLRWVGAPVGPNASIDRHRPGGAMRGGWPVE
jgi:uncharacterized membrane protein YccC